MERIVNGTYVDRLKNLRKSRKFTLRQMSKKLGYRSDTTYMYIEKGTTTPNIKIVNKISQIFERPANYFFDIKIQDTCTKGKIK